MYAASSRPNEIMRRIFFYRASIGLQPNGRPKPFHAATALAQIRSLPFSNGATSGRYWSDNEGNDLCCWPENHPHPTRATFGKVRRTGLPQVESAGLISNLPISPTSGLLDQTHVVFFPDNIVGAEFNFHGPRATRFAQYLRIKAPMVCPTLTFEPLLQRNVSERLANLKSITAFHLKVRASYAQAMAEANQDLGSAFAAAASVGGADEIELILKPKRRSGGNISNRLIQFAQQLVNRGDVREGAFKFTLDGTLNDGNHDTVDVLSDYLIAQKKILVMNGSSRALDADAVYAAILDAYGDLREDLERAAGVSA